MGLVFPRRIYLDSCVVIYEVEAKLPWFTHVDAALSAEQGSEFCYSDMSRLERSLGPVRAGDAAGLSNFDRFFAQATRLEMTTAVYDLATDLRAAHGLKTPDALHLATALTHGCDEFWTNDHQLARATTALAFRVF